MKNCGDRGGCYQPRRITPSEISIILYMIRKPNSIIVLLFIQHNSQFKNMAKTYLCISQFQLRPPPGLTRWANALQQLELTDGLPPLMLSCVKFIFDSACLGLFSSENILEQQMSTFELSSCCSCHVFSYYFTQFLLLKRVKCPPFFRNQNNSTSFPGLLG